MSFVTLSSIFCIGLLVISATANYVLDAPIYKESVKQEQVDIYNPELEPSEDLLMGLPFNCTTIEDCNFHGMCSPSGNQCVCEDSWATFKPEKVQCNYRRKVQLAALLLHIFLGNGVAHFYVGKLDMGFLLFFTVGWGTAVSLCCLVCIVGACLAMSFGADSDLRAILGGTCGGVIGVAFIFATSSIWIWILIVIAQNDLTDENGVALKPI